MDTTEIQNKIAELEKDFAAKMAELKSAIAEQGKKPGRWVPKVGENYYYQTSVDDICQTIANGGIADKFRVNSGNCFQTHEEAEAHQLIAVPKGDTEQMLWMVDYLRAGDGGFVGIGVSTDLGHGIEIFDVNGCYGTPTWSTESKAREWVESHGGEAEVARRLRIGWPK